MYYTPPTVAKCLCGDNFCVGFPKFDTRIYNAGYCMNFFSEKTKKWFVVAGRILVIIFALIGFSFVGMYVAIREGWTNSKSRIDTQREDFLKDGGIRPSQQSASISLVNVKNFEISDEWETVSSAITKDTNLINQVATLTDTDPRLLASIVAVEQLRLFYGDREMFEKIFAPLKILESQSVTSWGVVGVKPDTAKEIESYLVDKSSLYYPGDKYISLLDFSTSDHDKERFLRITDQHKRYYAYLYEALCIKETMEGWKNSGFPIDEKKGVLATLYNIGFKKYHPNPTPRVGGAEIDLGGEMASFGGLVERIYYNDMLLSVFSVKK